MSPQTQLDAKLTAIARRFRWLVVERRVSWCLLPGLAAALALVVAHKLDRLDEPTLFAGAAIAVSALAGLVWGLLRPVSLLEAAMLADERLGLKERLSTAVLFEKSPEASALVPALIRDASRHAASISLRQVLPHRPSRVMWCSLVLAALIGGASLAPVFPLGRTAGELAVRKQMKEQGRQLGQVAQKAKEDAQKRGLKTPEELAGRLEKLARELEKAKLSKKQALLKTGKLAQELREQQKQQALEDSRNGLARAAEALRNTTLQTKEAQELARAVREQSADDLANRLGRIAQELRAGKPTSEAERADLARDLRQLAGALEGTGLGDASGALREAADQLQQGKMQAAAEAAERAASQAAQSAQAQAERQTIERMAEQLEQSQEKVAQADEKPGAG
jgi:hypothetical protein